MAYQYKVHGLRLDSEFEIWGLRQISAAGGQTRDADIVVEMGDVPHHQIDTPIVTAEGYQVGAAEIVLTVPSVGRYRAREGRTLTIQPVQNVDPGALRLFLLGSGLAAILHQRGLSPLHASSIQHDGRCIAFLGDSGAGKSTLAALLSRRGYSLLSDDVLIAHVSDDGTVVVEPSTPVLKLWPESFGLSGLFAKAEASFECNDADKYLISAPEAFVDLQLPLSRLYILDWLDASTAEPEMVEVSPFDAMMALRRNIYRPTLVEAMRREPAFMSFAEALLRSVGVFKFCRAKNFRQANAQIDFLEHHFSLE
jgi:hypothetical protein